MSVRPRGKQYQASVSLGGKRYRRAFPDRVSAEQWEAEARSCLLNGREPNMGESGRKLENSAPQTLNDLMLIVNERFWKDQKAGEHSLKNAEKVVCILGRDTHPTMVDEQFIDNVVSVFKAEGNSGATINRKLAALSKMLTYAAERGYIKRKPKIDKFPEAEPRIRYLTQDEEVELLAAFVMRDRRRLADLCILLVDSGLRRGEALALEWAATAGVTVENLYGEGTAWIRVWDNKASHPRSVPCTERVVKVLRRLYTENPDEKGPFCDVSPSTFAHTWMDVRKSMGKADDNQFVPHALRHTFISRLLQRGVPLATVQKLAGHKCIQMTLRYAHLAPENLSDAIGVLEPTKTLVEIS